MSESPLLPPLAAGTGGEALRFGERALTYRQLARAAGAVAASIERSTRVAVWATPTLETCVAVVAVVEAGAAAVPLNPALGARELEHVVADSAPAAVVAAPDDELPPRLAALPRLDVDVAAAGAPLPAGAAAEAPALVVYTSGTTGSPKGVVLPRRAIASNLDALAEAWAWTAHD